MHLWTDPVIIMKEYIVPPERILHITRHYSIKDILYTLLLGGMGVLLLVFSGISIFSGSFFLGTLWLVLTLICIGTALNTLLRAFDNLFFVTTEKLIRTRRTSLFGNTIDPTHLDNVASAQATNEAWSLGIFGTVSVALKQAEQAGKIVKVRHMRDAGEIAAVIEKAVDLLRNRMYNETTIHDQQQQIEYIKKEAPAMGA